MAAVLLNAAIATASVRLFHVCFFIVLLPFG
jgi:hypothetical protein